MFLPLNRYALVVLCLAPFFAQAADYYVLPTGNDSHSGTQAAPLQSISRAVEMAGSGDRILVNGGDYAESITFYQKPGLTIEGLNMPTVRKHWIVSTGSDGLHIKGFKFDLAGLCQQAAITLRSGVHDVVIEDNQVYNAHLGGVSVEAQTNGAHIPNERLVVRNNYFERIPTAMYIIGKQHLVEGNTVVHGTQTSEGCPFVSNLDADGIKFYGQDHIIRNNQFWRMSFYTDDSFYNPAQADPLLKDSHTDCFQTSSMSWFAASGQYRNDKTNNVRIEGNVCDAFSIKNLDAGDTAGVMYLEQAENIYFYNNVTHGLGIGGQGHVKNLHIYHNTLTMRSEAWRTLDYSGWDADSEAQALIDLQSDFPDSIKIYNNILYDAHHAPVLIYDANWRTTDAAQVHNNLAYWRHGLDGDNGNTSSWHWFDCDKGVIEDALGNRCANPQFMDSEAFDFRLRASSPAIDAARPPAAISDAEQPATDFFGTARPNGLASDLGAQEFVAATPDCAPQQRGLVYLAEPQTSAACFSNALQVDGSAAENGSRFSTLNELSLNIELRPDPADQGQNATLLLLALVNGSWFMRDAEQQWQAFDGAFSGPELRLGDKLTLPLWQGRLFAGEFTLFAAYKLGERIVYNGQNPLRIEVKP